MKRITKYTASGEATIDERDLAAAINRLAQYEDSGIDPEDFCSARDMLAAAYDGIAPERMKELIAADQEGRLSIFPCKLGTRLFQINTSRQTKDGEDSVTIVNFKLNADNAVQIANSGLYGKTVFASKRAAVIAAREMLARKNPERLSGRFNRSDLELMEVVSQ